LSSAAPLPMLTAWATAPSTALTTSAVPATSSARDDIFSLDFTPPSSTQPSTQGAPPKDIKNDIMSLFSSSAAVPSVNHLTAGAPPHPSVPTSLTGQTGIAQWGVQSGWSAQPPGAASDPWGSFSSTQPPGSTFVAPVPTANPMAAALPQNIWASPQQPTLQPAQQPKDSLGSNVWGSNVNGMAAGGAGDSNFDAPSTPASSQQAKKDDVFGDIWGGFK